MILSKEYLLQEERRNITEYGVQREYVLYENAELSTHNSMRLFKILEENIRNSGS